jgi:hypothetical protein
MLKLADLLLVLIVLVLKLANCVLEGIDLAHVFSILELEVINFLVEDIVLAFELIVLFLLELSRRQDCYFYRFFRVIILS